jgi:hypothetical protein
MSAIMKDLAVSLQCCNLARNLRQEEITLFRTLGSLDYTEMKMKQIAGKVQAQEASINLIEGCLFQTFHIEIIGRSSFQIISLVKTLTFIEHTVLHSSRQLFSLPELTVIMNLRSESHTRIPKSMCCIF